jgi:ABC-type proline/glycine betaine transport system permease subunit
MTEELAETFDAPVKRSINKKRITLIGAAAVGVAVLALVVNDKLQKRDETVDDSANTES